MTIIDSEKERTCGTCMATKPNEEFYKDGKRPDGTYKYRRDCKDCYRITRIKASRKKGGKKK